MERKEDKDNYPREENKNEKNEKIVYKVIHVPYYYPVPVDAEWYYKHHDQFPHTFDHHSLAEGSPHFEHIIQPPPPPPGFPFARRRDYRDYRERRYTYDVDVDSMGYQDERRRTISPTQSRQQATRSSEKLPTRTESISSNNVSDDDHENPDNVDKKPFNSQDKEDEKREDGNEKEKGMERKRTDDKKEDDEFIDEEINDTSSDKSVEVNRKRKRYMMTFPYDQRKRSKTQVSTEQTEDESKDISKEEPDDYEKSIDANSERSIDDAEDDRKYRKRMLLSSEHADMIPSHLPYVMVPIRSSQYLSPEMHYESHYQSNRSHASYDTRHYDKVHGSNRESRPYERRAQDKDEKKELRFHPNGRRARTVFTRQQLMTLNNVFEKHPFVSGERMSELSDQLGLDRKIVKIWFQNKRQYARKKGSLLEREDDYYYGYPGERYISAPPPTMAERWKN